MAAVVCGVLCMVCSVGGRSSMAVGCDFLICLLAAEFSLSHNLSLYVLVFLFFFCLFVNFFFDSYIKVITVSGAEIMNNY